MDSSEKLVEKYLKSVGYSDIVFEPDGNVTPDFVVNGTIAVEVRRLNQTHFDGEQAVGLENLDISLYQFFRKLCDESGPPPSEGSWFLAYDYERPLDFNKAFRKQIRTQLDIAKNSSESRLTVIKQHNFTLEIVRASTQLQTCFRIGFSSDQNSGGFIAAEIVKNLQLSINEKWQKIIPKRTAYTEWWLILPDHIGYMLGEDASDELPTKKDVRFKFNRVILLHPNDHLKAWEVL